MKVCKASWQFWSLLQTSVERVSQKCLSRWTAPSKRGELRCLFPAQARLYFLLIPCDASKDGYALAHAMSWWKPVASQPPCDSMETKLEEHC